VKKGEMKKSGFKTGEFRRGDRATRREDSMHVRRPKAKKSFGQHFLNDASFLETIAREVKTCASGTGAGNKTSAGAEIAANTDLGKNTDATATIFEIGAGLGALTRALLKEGLTLQTIERDRDLVPILAKDFAGDIAAGRLVLHEANAATFDYEAHAKKDVFVLCGNLPYQLTSTLMFQSIELCTRGLLASVFMVQKEVADRLVAPPGSRTYGMLSVMVQAYFQVGIVCDVPRQAFDPPPKVDSSVVSMNRRAKALVPVELAQVFKQVVKAAFSQRRKKLKNCLSALGDGHLDLDAVFVSADVNPDARAETLAVSDFVRLAKEVAHARRA
jgi:16S rRNA (adenine1518-N6/adenine1519-N6)-dimethyltransferase